MLHSSVHQQYLQRKPQPSSSSLFGWLFCCSNPARQPDDDILSSMKRPAHIIAKRPLKQRSTQTGSLCRIDIKENWKEGEIATWSDRVNMESSTTGPMRMSLQVEQPNRLPSGSESMRRNCKVRFSYVQPKGQASFIKQQPLQKQNSMRHVLSAMQTKQSFTAPPLSNFPQINQPIPQLENSSQYHQKTSSGSITSQELLSPRLAGRKDSAQSPKLKKQKKGSLGRFSLKMRQVQSIRQPQEDSDHESVVIDDDEESGLFGLLLPIREVEKESRVGCSMSRDDDRE